MNYTMKAECVMSAEHKQQITKLDRLHQKPTAQGPPSQGQPHPFSPEQVMAINRLYATYIEGKLMATQQSDLADMILEEESSGLFTPPLCGQHLVKARLMTLVWLGRCETTMDEPTAARTFLSALTDRTPSRYMYYRLYEHHRFKS
jgi:hypothetical protein